MVETVPEAGYVIPSARYCNSISDFWAAADQSKDTRDEIETSPISSTWIYPVSFRDDFTSGGADSPLIELHYEIYYFVQYGLMRENEETADVFESKTLEQHNKFIAGWLGIKSAFQGKRNIDGLNIDLFITQQTSPLIQTEIIVNSAVCEFIPGLVGHAVRFIEAVKLKFEEC